MTAVHIRRLEPADWPAVERIYREGIATGNATFEAEPPDWQAFDRSRVSDVRLVATERGVVVGWAAATRVSPRDVYRGVIEHSLYVAEAARGTGIGGVLLNAFVEASESAGYWTIQSSIFPENAASLALHERVGFRTVGLRQGIARMGYGPWHGQWRDTVLIERRSAAVAPPGASGSDSDA
ncbi:GNAT family N-acetyltransferase [Herbiconiux daphne]|uniref:GNAT family N-acetyltransferase n=1 Tax=Herbiconiux daphne TaxID=2970914 RepID=A0ABT2GZK4_9MICO|nr:GNAT family N-acetyltransferase [Herbiconiux daphne]MCS5733398.1 GNAT family N-acetyltransferase [Herbiconiux daphne]